MKTLGIIIVAYNGRKYVAPLLGSLAATIDPTDAVVWVLDNASTDGTADEVERLGAEMNLPLRLIRHDSNAGFMQGNNLAYAALCRETPCEAVVLLNLDTVAHPGWWQPLVAALRDPAVGTVASLLLLPDGTVNSRGNALHFLGLGFVRDYGAAVDAPPLSDAPMFFGSGAAVAFRPEVLERVNAQLGVGELFWPELVIYAEDTDLGWRMRLVGLDNRLADASRVTHDHRFWLQGLEAVADRLFLLERNRYLMMLVNFRAATLVVLLPWLAAMEVALALRLWKLYPHRLRLWRAIWTEIGSGRFRSRRELLQKGRTVRDRVILRAMTGSIRHGAVPFRVVDRWLDAGLRASHWLLCRIVWW